MNHWPKIVSSFELDPQAMLTVRLPILSKNIIHYDVRSASRPVGLLLIAILFIKNSVFVTELSIRSISKNL